MVIISATDHAAEAVLAMFGGMTEEESGPLLELEFGERCREAGPAGPGAILGGALPTSSPWVAAVSAPPLAALYTTNYRDTVPNDPYPFIDSKSQRYQELGSDPASKSFRENEAGLALLMEQAGRWVGTVRDPTGAGDFIVDGVVWDAKGFVSGVKPGKGGFKLQRALQRVLNELEIAQNVLIDTRRMSATDIKALKDEINRLKLADPALERIEFYP